jgi:hypothetical protein
MNSDSEDSTERLRYRERYSSMADDDLARLALDDNLIPAAREAIAKELEARGLRDLSPFKKRFDEDAALAIADGLTAFLPLNARPEPRKTDQYLGLTVLGMFGLVGLHKWLLGDATTWRKEEALAIWLFFALVFTWYPTAQVLKRHAARKLLFWLILGWLYVAVTAAPLLVPALGRVVGELNPFLVLAVFASPAIVLGVRRAVGHFARRS